jgi:hypothetical protein
VEAAILLLGEPLPAEHKANAITIGINRADDVRLIVRSQIILPTDAELRHLATATGLINQGTVGMTFGHGSNSWWSAILTRQAKPSPKIWSTVSSATSDSAFKVALIVDQDEEFELKRSMDEGIQSLPKNSEKLLGSRTADLGTGRSDVSSLLFESYSALVCAPPRLLNQCDHP